MPALMVAHTGFAPTLLLGIRVYLSHSDAKHRTSEKEGNAQNGLVTHAGFEPCNSALRRRRLNRLTSEP